MEYEPEPPAWSAAARFPSPRTALGHVAATAALGPPRLRRSPHDDSVWALLGPAQRAGIALVAGYGGTAYQADTDGVLWPEDRSAPGARPADRMTDVIGWDDVPLAELAGHSPAGTPPPGLREIAVLAPGALARWLLRRALATGVHTTFTPVERLGPDGRFDAGWLLLMLRAADSAVPAGLVEACGRLPGTVACRPADPDCRVLIDLRLQLPVPDAVLLDKRADGLHVVVEAATVGPPWHWRPLGKPASGALLDAGPVLSTTEPVRTPVPVPALGPPLPVRLVPSPRAPGRVDAVLISDAELDGLRRFLRSRPLHETAVVAFGPGRHLVTEPPGLLESLPFGTCVYQAGPGALYLESGCVLSPPLPDPAREEVLGLGTDVIKVLCRDGAWELRLEDVRPAWHLWVPQAPAFATGVSQPARELLSRLDQLTPAPESTAPAAVRTPETERRRLNQAAMEHSLRGEYREAAELLEQAGHFQRAAQLYERAAAQLDEAR
ncbi:hypothetical protein [Streptomyces endophyticus]|uniref:FtsH ternary system domain-containing protein n=1 Tax=Streptomyces endophyticus TaxID=714166 RepID=A0ABU6FG54_9ACTN|nr:hypothetical protein [Streptomyces endophyticus]MEB8343012.1 hypothetical protein [Streptomyces endophyticus]